MQMDVSVEVHDALMASRCTIPLTRVLEVHDADNMPI
jgi:hypothetical protein